MLGTRDNQKQLENHTAIILVTRRSDKDKAVSLGTCVFYIPFCGLGRFMRKLIVMAKYHRSCAATVILDLLPKKGSLCFLWESVCHLGCDSSILWHSAPPTAGASPMQDWSVRLQGLCYGARWLCQGRAQPGCLSLGICHSGLTWLLSDTEAQPTDLWQDMTKESHWHLWVQPPGIEKNLLVTLLLASHSE